MPGFDIEAARKEGYSDDEILKHLTETRKFDIEGALKEGYTRQELIDHLSGSSVPPNPQNTQHQALSNFFSSLGQVLNQGLNPIPMIQEYVNRPNQMKAAMDVMGTRRGTPEEAAALERGMQVPLSTPGILSDSPVPMGLEPGATAMYQGFVQKDPAGAAGTLIGSYGVLPAAYAGIGYGAGKVAGAVAEGPGRTLFTEEGRNALRQSKGLAEPMQIMARGPDDPVQLLTQGLRAKSANNRWRQAAKTAADEVALSSEQTGIPITNMDEALDAVNHAKKRVWAQREIISGPQSLRGITLEPVADAMERTISKYAEMMEPADVKAVREMAAQYRGRTFTIQEADDLLRSVNNRLKTYYAKNPLAQRVAAENNPEVAALSAQADALRARIYGSLDALGQGEGPRELSRRYGALLQLEEELYKRKPISERQAQESFPEQMSFARAAGKTAKGAFRMKSGDIAGGGADIAEAWASRKMAQDLKEAGTTNALIERAFRNYKDRPAPVNYVPVQPRALLGSGPVITPPPADPSGITITTGPPLKPRIRGYLEAPPLVTPPPADPSGIMVTTGAPLLPKPADIVDAVRRIAKDPKTGRLYVY